MGKTRTNVVGVLAGILCLAVAFVRPIAAVYSRKSAVTLRPGADTSTHLVSPWHGGVVGNLQLRSTSGRCTLWLALKPGGPAPVYATVDGQKACSGPPGSLDSWVELAKGRFFQCMVPTRCAVKAVAVFAGKGRLVAVNKAPLG